MEHYVTSLLESDLPFGPLAAAVAWATLFIANHWIVVSARRANDAQHLVAVEDWSALNRSSEPRRVVVQVAYGGIVFACALFLGGFAYVFFAGGLIVALALAIGLNLQGLLSARDLARPNVATGLLSFSTEGALRRMAHRTIGVALTALVAGLLLAHMALLGGAFFLFPLAMGYRRRARNARAQS